MRNCHFIFFNMHYFIRTIYTSARNCRLDTVLNDSFRAEVYRKKLLRCFFPLYTSSRNCRFDIVPNDSSARKYFFRKHAKLSFHFLYYTSMLNCHLDMVIKTIEVLFAVIYFRAELSFRHSAKRQFRAEVYWMKRQRLFFGNMRNCRSIFYITLRCGTVI